MKFIGEQHAFREKLTDSGAVSEQALIDFVIGAYFSTHGNFTALHCITALHAFRIVGSRYALDVAAFAAALSAAWLTLQKPYSPPPAATGVRLDWDAVTTQACRSPDDHTIKLVYTCHCLWKQTGDERFADIAGHRTNLSGRANTKHSASKAGE